MIIGADHTVASDCVYANIDVNDDTDAAGVAAIDDSYYAGSISHFAPTTPNAAQLYAYTISRDCSTIPAAGPYCLEVNTTALPGDHAMVVAERAYLQRPTRTGPAYADLLMPLILRFATPNTTAVAPPA